MKMFWKTALGFLVALAGCGGDGSNPAAEDSSTKPNGAKSDVTGDGNPAAADSLQSEKQGAAMRGPMAEEVALIDRILEDPARDEPRQAYAAWLEPRDAARAELVRLEIELRGLRYPDPRLLDVQERRNKLLEANRSRWTEPIRKLLGDDGWADFEGGLIDSISVRGVTDERLALLDAVPGLRRLEIGSSKVGVSGMQAVARLKHLGDLTLNDVVAPRDALLELGSLPAWAIVRASGTGCDAEALAEAARMRVTRFGKLEPAARRAAAIRLLNTFSFRPIPADQPVKNVDLSQSGITDAQVRVLSVLSEMESFNVSECYELTSAGLAHLAGMKHLKRLELWDTTVTSIAPITNCTTLETLNVFPEYDTQMGDAGTRGLEKLTNLRELYLSDRAIGDATLERIGALTKLEKLDLTLARLEREESFEALSKLTALKNLSFHGVSLSDGALEALAPLEKLTVLNINVDRGDGTRLRHLGGLPQLKSLYLSGNAVTDAGIAHLGNLTGLRTLMAQGSAVTESGAEKLAAKLPHVTIILDEHVVKSPRTSYTLRRRAVKSVASALLPADWQDDSRFTHADSSIGVIEDGWERVGGWSGSHVAPAIIRFYLLPGENYRSADDAMMKSVNNNSHLNPRILRRDVQAIADAQQSASCIYKNDHAQYLVCTARIGEWMLLFDCETAVPRFAAFEPLFLSVARSIRLGGEPSRHAAETVTVPVADLPSGKPE